MICGFNTLSLGAHLFRDDPRATFVPHGRAEGYLHGTTGLWSLLQAGVIYKM